MKVIYLAATWAKAPSNSYISINTYHRTGEPPKRILYFVVIQSLFVDSATQL